MDMANMSITRVIMDIFMVTIIIHGAYVSYSYNYKFNTSFYTCEPQFSLESYEDSTSYIIYIFLRPFSFE